MPRSGVNGTYSLPPNTNNQAPNTPISSSMFNAFASDVQQTFNDPTPVAYGGTGAATTAAAATALEVVSYAAQTLSGPQKAQARDNIAAVSFEPQTLSGPQKAQARDNIGANLNKLRNLFVNGSFGVSQENGDTLGTTNGYYPADQIALYFTAATAAVSVQRVQVRTLANALDQIEFKTTTAKAVLDANDFVTLTQNIEGSAFAASGFGTAAAVPLVLRAEVNLPAGTYHFHFANSANDRHCAVPFTVDPGEANTAVVKEIVVPADTSGTWLTADGVIGITCDLVLAAGSGLTGGAASTWGSTAYLAASTQKNILDSTSNVARLADIGLRLDPDATGVYGQYEVGETHAVYRSERYWRKSYGVGVAPGTATALGGVSAGININNAGSSVSEIAFPIKMAKASGTISVWDFAGSANSVSSYSVQSATVINGEGIGAAPFDITTTGFKIRCGTTISGSRGFFLHYTANARLS